MAAVVVDQAEPERHCADLGCAKLVTCRIFWRYRSIDGVAIKNFWSCALHQRWVLQTFGPEDRTVRTEAV